MIYIETPRLLLRDWEEKDLKPFSDMNKDSLVMEFFLKKLTEDESLDFYDRIRNEFLQCGYGLYAVELKEDRSFMGYTGFHNITFEVDFAPAVEIGWRLRQEYWNKGYATEAAKACLDYAEKHLPFTTVYSFTSLPNIRSERVMQKIGMKKIKEFPHPSVPDGHPLKEHVLYGIDL
nr:GNAT family N-acetyltransferase [uncultured Bacteroides sp.]